MRAKGKQRQPGVAGQIAERQIAAYTENESWRAARGTLGCLLSPELCVPTAVSQGGV